MDPHNSRVLFAGMSAGGTVKLGEFSGGQGSGIYVSRDSSTKWTPIEVRGLPKPPVGKIECRLCPWTRAWVYALIPTIDQGSAWRSDEGRETWRIVNHQRVLLANSSFFPVVPPEDSSAKKE